MKRHSFRGHRYGVALLEVLLSVSLLTAGVGATMRTLTVSARTQSALENKALGRQLAERLAADLKIAGTLSQSGEISGQFEAPFAAYSWTAHTYDTTESLQRTLVELKIWRAVESQRKLLYTTRALAW